jgi:hypothetical protein
MIIGPSAGRFYLKGATDNTLIGNVADAIKVVGQNTPYNPSYVRFDPRGSDAIGRFRVSEPRTLFELSAAEGIDPIRYVSTEVVGTGAIAYDANSVSVKLSVSANGDRAVTQTRRRIEYNQGTSQFALIECRFATPTANVRQRRGYFSQSHGIFFEIDGTTKYVCRRSSLSGSVVDTRVAQANWNVDKLDGTGPSGKTWIPTEQTSLAIDFVYNVPVIRYYIAIDGEYHLCHFDTLSGLTVPFMDSGMAPLRSEMEATGVIGATYDSYTTAAVVASEGNEVELGRIRVVDTGTTTVSVGSTDTIVAGLRLQSGKIKGSIKPLSFKIKPESGNNSIFYQVIYNPTLTGDGSSWGPLTGLADGLNPAGVTYTGGSVIDSGYLDVGGKDAASANTNLESDIFLGSDIAGVADKLIMVIRTLSGNGTVLFSGSYREFF